MNNYFRPEAGKPVPIQEALDQRLIAPGDTPGTIWVNGNRVQIRHAVEAGIIDQAAADYLASPA